VAAFSAFELQSAVSRLQAAFNVLLRHGKIYNDPYDRSGTHHDCYFLSLRRADSTQGLEIQ
jgi:hypothetical protein